MTTHSSLSAPRWDVEDRMVKAAHSLSEYDLLSATFTSVVGVGGITRLYETSNHMLDSNLGVHDARRGFVWCFVWKMPYM